MLYVLLKLDFLLGKVSRYPELDEEIDLLSAVISEQRTISRVPGTALVLLWYCFAPGKASMFLVCVHLQQCHRIPPDQHPALQPPQSCLGATASPFPA